MFPAIPVLEPVKLEPIAIVQKIEQPETPKEPPKPVEYIIKPGDTLTKIAEAHKSSVSRIWAYNSQLQHPDNIKLNEPLKIPHNEEIVPERPFPTPPEPPTTQSPVTPSKTLGGKKAVAGNTYAPGYCTWHAKNMRPDLPNNLGNADTWYVRARSQGYNVGDTPQVGAVAATKAYMHVSIVIAVNGSNVTVSEMNYKGLYVVSTRVAPASEFRYIY